MEADSVKCHSVGFVVDGCDEFAEESDGDVSCEDPFLSVAFDEFVEKGVVGKESPIDVVLHVLYAGGGCFDGAEYWVSCARLGYGFVADVALLEFEVKGNGVGVW